MAARSGGANVFPRLYVQLYEAAAAGNVGRCVQLHTQVMQISNSLYQVGHHAYSGINGTKCALSCLGICDDFMAEPFHRFGAEARAKVQRHLAKLTVAVEKLAPAANHHPHPPLAATRTQPVV